MNSPAACADAQRSSFERPDLERFRDAIVQHIGLQFADTKLAFLDAVLRRRLLRLSCPAASSCAHAMTSGLSSRPRPFPAELYAWHGGEPTIPQTGENWQGSSAARSAWRTS